MTLCFWFSLKPNWFLPSMTQRIKIIRLSILPLAFPAFPLLFLQFTRNQKRGVFNFLSLLGWDLLYTLDSFSPTMLSSIYPSLASNGRIISYRGDACGTPRFGSFIIYSLHICKTQAFDQEGKGKDGNNLQYCNLSFPVPLLFLLL